MQMKLEDEKESANDKPKNKHDRFGGEKGAESDFCSTFQSIDLPPKEYEQQLQ